MGKPRVAQLQRSLTRSTTRGPGHASAFRPGDTDELSEGEGGTGIATGGDFDEDFEVKSGGERFGVNARSLYGCTPYFILHKQEAEKAVGLEETLDEHQVGEGGQGKVEDGRWGSGVEHAW